MANVAEQPADPTLRGNAATNAPSNLLLQVSQAIGIEVTETSFRDNVRWTIPSDRLIATLQTLRDDHRFDMLMDITAIDYLEFPEASDRFGIVYVLLNTTTGQRRIVKTFANPPATLPTVTPLYQGANWMEREIYDMFGIDFAGHPDLRRILMPDEFNDYPLRKDYPLQGRGERHNFPVITRSES